jgi:hypothetical protein
VRPEKIIQQINTAQVAQMLQGITECGSSWRIIFAGKDLRFLTPSWWLDADRAVSISVETGEELTGNTAPWLVPI